MAKEKGITIMQLYAECVKQINAGNGNRHIMISGDDEVTVITSCSMDSRRARMLSATRTTCIPSALHRRRLTRSI